MEYLEVSMAKSRTPCPAYPSGFRSAKFSCRHHVSLEIQKTTLFSLFQHSIPPFFSYPWAICTLSSIRKKRYDRRRLGSSTHRADILLCRFLIGAADTWFATTTTPIIQEQLTRHFTPIHAYGRGINSSECAEDSWVRAPCPSNSQAICYYPCNIEIWISTTAGGAALKEGIKRAQESAETLLGNSNTNVVQQFSSQAYGQKDDAQQYYFLGDARSGQGLDFVALTIAVTTQCEVVTQNCELNLNNPGFSCFGYQSPSFTYTGKVGIDPTASMVPDNVTMNTVGIQFFKDSGLQSPIGFGNHSTELFVAQNPVHFLTWSKGFPPVDTSTTQWDEMRQNKFLQLDTSGDNVFVLNCSFSIYNATYAWVNGTILRHNQKAAFYPLLAPDMYGAIFGAPFAMNSALGQLSLENAAALAAYKSKPQDLSNRFADEFSRAAVALSSGIMSPAKNLLEQSRNNAEVLTRVPKVPFYLLIGLQSLYALSCIILASLAYVLTGIHEAQEIKTRLTVDGLVAGLFEPNATQEQVVNKTEELWEEHEYEESQAVGQEDGDTKVGIKKTETGAWIWFRTGKGQNA